MEKECKKCHETLDLEGFHRMARKRKKLQHLDYNSPEYWNRLLAEEGLTLHAGEDKRQVYVGDSGSLDFIQEDQSQRETGRTLPKPQCP